MNKNIQEPQIVEGKRNRVMSRDGVLAVVTKELLKHSITKDKFTKPKPTNRTKKVQKESRKGKKEMRQNQLKSDESNSNSSKESNTDHRIRITRAALKELIEKHFIVIDGVQDLIEKTKKKS